MLDEKTKVELKVRLEKEKEVLEQELEKLGTRNPANPSDWIPAMKDGQFGADRNDNADIIEEMTDANASLNELEGRLNEVLAALEKMEKNSYGVCVVGNEDIEADRLNANPAASTCKAHMNG